MVSEKLWRRSRGGHATRCKCPPLENTAAFLKQRRSPIVQNSAGHRREQKRYHRDDLHDGGHERVAAAIQGKKKRFPRIPETVPLRMQAKNVNTTHRGNQNTSSGVSRASTAVSTASNISLLPLLAAACRTLPPRIACFIIIGFIWQHSNSFGKRARQTSVDHSCLAAPPIPPSRKLPVN